MPWSVTLLDAGSTLGRRPTEENDSTYSLVKSSIISVGRRTPLYSVFFVAASSKAFATTASNVDRSLSFNCLVTASAQALKPSAKRFSGLASSEASAALAAAGSTPSSRRTRLQAAS